MDQEPAACWRRQHHLGPVLRWLPGQTQLQRPLLQVTANIETALSLYHQESFPLLLFLSLGEIQKGTATQIVVKGRKRSDFY